MLQTPSTAIDTQNQTNNKNGEFSNKMLQTQTQPLLTDDIDIEAFSMAARSLESKILGKVIDHLAQIYNEKTGQKIKVIFRKMIEDDNNNNSSSGTTKDKDSAKKYQPTPDEVKKRENKVLSLVKEGVIRISELVEQSGVPESPIRRYLLKAGYKISAGTLSH